MPFSRPTHRSGFTLLEIALIIVIVILFVTALIPLFRGKKAEKHYELLPPPPSPTPEVLFTPPPVPTIAPLPGSPVATPAPAEKP